MKVQPVSADMLIKIGLVLGAVGLVWFGYKKVSDALGSITSLPGKVIDKAVAAAKEGGAAFQDQYAENAAPTISDSSNYGNEGRSHTDVLTFPGYGHKYNGPLVNDQGYDFGQLSGA